MIVWLKYLRAFGRLLFFALYTLIRVAQILLLNLLLGHDLNRAMRIRKSWARTLLPAIGVRMHVEGKPPAEPCLLMGNHRSYLDPIVIIHDVIACPVSKAEVAAWPIVGYGAKVTGILFLKRESIGSRKKTLSGISDQVREGFAVILFPEGTTHDLPQCMEFKFGGFNLAAQESIPVAPIAIDYRNKADYWIGNDTFLPHFLKSFGEREIHVHVRYGPLLRDADPEILRKSAMNWINQELTDIRKSF